jgi:anaphase-promoting complex subunit 4
LNIPYASLPYEDHSEGKIPKGLQYEVENLGDLLSAARIPSATGFVPIHMEVVEGTSERGELPARVCLLGKDRHTYKVFAIPPNWKPKTDAVLHQDVMMEE